LMPRAEKNSAISLTKPGRSGPIDEKTTYDLISQLRNFFRSVMIYVETRRMSFSRSYSRNTAKCQEKEEDAFA